MLLEIILLLLSIPTGLLIAHWTKDELRAGKKWFYTILATSLLLGIYAAVQNQKAIFLTSIFVIIITLISLIKSRSTQLLLNPI